MAKIEGIKDHKAIKDGAMTIDTNVIRKDITPNFAASGNFVLFEPDEIKVYQNEKITGTPIMQGKWMETVYVMSTQEAYIGKARKNDTTDLWHARLGHDEVEKANRYKIFKENVEFIESFNMAGIESYKLGINQFADLTNNEFREACSGYKPWKECKGMLFSCGSHKRNSLAQNCHGLRTESNYPYQAVDGTCNTNKEASPSAKIIGQENVSANNEAALFKAVANQPVSVAIDASGSAFQFYTSGVFISDYGIELDWCDSCWLWNK
ncbi:hypothetical protein ACH5RR_002776 [Cinchona calisaya]|uniref:Uncharacterized protein n=1 Tax=Cinchona calisaya TaxID=153742 RepID=A0ABD3ASY3_9GENT